MTMSRRLLERNRRAGGFTLLELLFVIAIVAVLAILIIEGVTASMKSSECKKALDKAKAASKTCLDSSSSWDKDSALSCLTSAQSALNAYFAACEPSEATRQALNIAVIDLNGKVDELKSRVESDEDKEKLEKAKLHVPAKGEGAGKK
jgi:prepilin-type N-terminal cleavage/methylation domain-containing protein